MQLGTVIPWEKYALIIELAIRTRGIGQVLGKTALQKYIYFLQAIFGVDVGYDFQLYTYGPFTSEILQDLDLVESFGGVKVLPDDSGFGGYIITPGEKFKMIRGNGRIFLERKEVNDALNWLMKKFGQYTAKDLELRATIVYVDRDLSRTPDYTHERLINIVKEIKPKFSNAEIERVVTELKDDKIILSNVSHGA
jgi:uncharacterized protein